MKTNSENFLTADDLDAIGEVLNISMGAAATAVSSVAKDNGATVRHIKSTSKSAKRANNTNNQHVILNFANFANFASAYFK